MKKIIVVIMVLVLMSTVCACGNLSLGIGSLEFNRVHIDTHHRSGCLTVEKWYENNTGIEVKTREAGSLYLSEGTYFLVADDCPFCDLQMGKEY